MRLRILIACTFLVIANASNSTTIAELNSYIQLNYESGPKQEVLETEMLSLYETYLKTFGKVKSTFGFGHFTENVKKIIKHNRENHSWKMGINQFVDISYDEFKHYNLLHGPQNCSATTGSYVLRNSTIPESIDWREKDAVSPVKNQLKCGSCWTFSTTGTLESHWKIFKGGNFLDLSKQQLVDCAGAFDNHGCQGGLPSHAFEYIKYVGGIQSEEDYPYRAANGECKFDESKIVAYVRGGSVNLTAGCEKELDEALATVGPVSIAFQVIEDFRFYKSGVYTSKTCRNGPDDVNHAVEAVGYGVDKNNVPYYIVKNSWSANWGMDGFFLIKRGVNMCGVAQCNSYPLLEKQGVTVEEK